MLSFSKIVLLATSACAALVSAAPVDGNPASAPEHNVGNVVVAPLTNVEANIASIHQRHDLHSLPTIIVDVTAQLVAVSDKLNSIVAVKADVEAKVFIPLITDIKNILSEATIAVRLLVDQPIAIILAYKGEVITVDALAHLLVALLSVVAGALCVVVDAVGGAKLYVIAPLLSEVGDILAGLLIVIFAIVGSLLVALKPILGDVVVLIHHLSLVAVIKVLGV